MCTGLELLAGTGIGLSVLGSVQQGQASQQSANFQAQQDQQTASDIQAQGYQQAKRIRSQRDSTLGQANAALASSGVDVNTGTSNDIRQRIVQNNETDALNTILSADNKATSLRQQAEMEVSSGQNAASAGALSGVASALRGAASLSKGGWKTAATTQGGSS